MTTAAPAKPDQDHARLLELRALAEEHPVAAQAQAWTWLTSLDACDADDRARFDALFAEGAPPVGPDGDCEGKVLGIRGTSFLRIVDRLERLGQRLGGIGWTGKSFDADSGVGFNRLTTTSRIPMFAVMPGYGFDRRNGELVAFRFDHRLEASPYPPHQEVRAITYDNPAYGSPLMLPRTRDELVELIDDVYLGRALLNEDDAWKVVAYFALRYPVGGKR